MGMRKDAEQRHNVEMARILRGATHQLPINEFAHNAAVIGDAAVAAVLAALDMAAEGGGAAGLDRRHDLELAEADMAGMGRAPSGPVSAEDVGDLERGTHGDQPPGLGPSSRGAPVLGVAIDRLCAPICAVILSSGLVTIRTILVATRV